MARWETYRFGNTIRLRRAGEKAPLHTVAVPAEVTVASPTFESMNKAELVAEAESRGLDASGTKAEILERLNG